MTQSHGLAPETLAPAAGPFVPLVVDELNRVAAAIAHADGEDFNEYNAARYRAQARAASLALAGCVRDRMSKIRRGGRDTRAGWMVAVIEGVAEVDTDALDAADEERWA